MADKKDPKRDVFKEIRSGLSGFGNKVNKLVDDIFSNDTPEEVDASADIYQTDSFFVIEIELPGVKKEDLKLHINDDILTVKATKKRSNEGEDITYIKQKRTFGDFHQDFPLPDGIELERIKAKFDLGILTVRFPRIIEQDEELNINID